MSLRLLNPPHPLTFPTISPNPPPGYEPEVEFTKLSDAKAENWLAAAFWILGIYYGFIAKPRPKPYESFSNMDGRKYPYRNNPKSEIELTGTISPETVKRAVSKTCEKLVKRGFKKPQFRVDGYFGDHFISGILSDQNSKRGIQWNGEYADFDSIDLKSNVFPGDTVTLYFHVDEYDKELKQKVRELAGTVELNTANMEVEVQFEQKFALPFSQRNPVPPPSVAAAAKRGLELRSQVAPSKRGGTSVGLARARQLARRQNISEQTIKRMRSFFARHEVDKKAKGFRKGEKGYPSKGLQAWLLWGGDAGKAWANKFRR